jgi:hypothetical protein
MLGGSSEVIQKLWLDLKVQQAVQQSHGVLAAWWILEVVEWCLGATIS